MKQTFAQVVKKDVMFQEILAMQYADGTNQFTLRKSFELYLDNDAEMQAELVELVQQEGGFKHITYQEIRDAVYANCDVEKVFVPINIFDQFITESEETEVA